MLSFLSLIDIPFRSVYYFQLYRFGIDLKQTNTESLSDAFASSKKLHENGFYSCFSSFRSIFSSLDIPYANNELNFMNLNNFKKSIKRIVLTRYKEF